ncbi:hypothetical protein LMG29739_04840 [Paraburkholderia solisilvae]|uniref:Uncharacterized protein n=1 Tax=Paraburkholderia solisilvae TaxID=624376 RepID=A0A6J5ELW0_9BURK|nr:hypothetical protein LMG29739_04840 [Paraburkholderia solisilvae]
MSALEGKTGIIHGIEVTERDRIHESKARIATDTKEGREAILRAAEKVYERHHDVIRALAKR